jgi:hypothetical protein
MIGGPSDEHILNAIALSDVQNVFVGLYGDPDSQHNRQIIDATGRLSARRRIGVQFYQAESTSLW